MTSPISPVNNYLEWIETLHILWLSHIYIYLSSIIFHLNQHVLPTKWCQTRDALKVAKHDCPKHQTLQFMPLTIIIIQLLQPIMIIPITILSHIQPVLSHVKTYYHTTSCPMFIHFYHMILLLLVINCPMIVGLNAMNITIYRWFSQPKTPIKKRIHWSG